MTRQKQIELEMVMACCEKGRVRGNRGVVVHKLGDNLEDFNDIMSPNSLKIMKLKGKRRFL